MLFPTKWGPSCVFYPWYPFNLIIMSKLFFFVISVIVVLLLHLNYFGHKST